MPRVVLLHSLDARAAAGVTRYARELAQALRAEGEPVQELRARPYELRLGRRRVGGFATMRLQAMLRPLRKRDLLHSAYHYAAHPRCDLATVHDLFPETRPKELGYGPRESARLAAGTRRLARRGVHLLCVSEATRQALLASQPVPDGQAEVAPPGIAARFAPPGPGDARHPAFQDGRLNVLCVADLNPRKRLDWLLQAALDLDDPDLRIVHVGPQTVRRPPWAAQAEAEKPLADALGDRFLRLGRLDDGELLRAYRSADLLVLPTLDEGFGFPPLEALSCGTPVAVTDLPVLRESLGGQATYFEGAEGLAKALGQAPRRPPTQRERQARHRWVQERHGWPKAARRVADAYRRMRGG